MRFYMSEKLKNRLIKSNLHQRHPDISRHLRKNYRKNNQKIFVQKKCRYSWNKRPLEESFRHNASLDGTYFSNEKNCKSNRTI